MSTNNGGALVTIMWILTIFFSIVAGVISWDWVDPDGIFGLIGFLLVWGILSTVGHFLAIGITTLLGRIS